ncbi:MAG: NFACT family protein [Gloeomargaritaceae cyanobacterium C42_A2020_066]|nr:NFACT family protein [Gloeomargaritaceae cyanobacterium C42_A2020_066]
MQPCDLTTLVAACAELERGWLPARLEQVYQVDKHTVLLHLRTLEQRGWLALSWHPQAARLAWADPPPRQPDTFTFSQQLWHQLGNLALTELRFLDPWERVVALGFSRRPADPPQAYLYVEVMGRYSNVILTDATGTIITCAHQVSAQESRVRPLLTGEPYQPPPALTQRIPTLSESLIAWRDQVALIPQPLGKALLGAYRGLSTALVQAMTQAAGLDATTTTPDLTPVEWTHLYTCWQTWLTCVQQRDFQPGWTPSGYTVLGWGITRPAASVHDLLRAYYIERLQHQATQHLHQQLSQKVSHHLLKLHQKRETFQLRLAEADRAHHTSAQADLLMAHPQVRTLGFTQIELPDFHTGRPVAIPLNPDKTAIQNAQALYKRAQKLKRAHQAVQPLLAQVEAERYYWEQLDTALQDLCDTADLALLQDIQEELRAQGHLPTPPGWRKPSDKTDKSGDSPHFLHYTSPNGHPILVGRNNRQNEILTFRLATDYDLWFHTLEIPGSHVLLRLPPGRPAEDSDLQTAAHIAAYHSRARHSQQVPVVYTRPSHVHRPRGNPPGLVTYQRETLIWGRPSACP